MKEPWKIIVAGIAIAGTLIGVGVSYRSLDVKADAGVNALEMAHEQKVDMACMKQSISRIPVIESKLDKLLEK